MKAVRIAREIESAISTYLLTNTATNALEGVMVTLALWALGMPTRSCGGCSPRYSSSSPISVPCGTRDSVDCRDGYLPDPGHAALIPAAFLLANIIQANVVSPS